MKLDLDLVDALEQTSEDLQRKFHSTIESSLRRAVWAHSNGRSPHEEMLTLPWGFADWGEKIRARRETRELKRLFDLGEGEK
jgi:hypothetical protein